MSIVIWYNTLKCIFNRYTVKKNLKIKKHIMYALLLSFSNEKTEGNTRISLFV
jgi:hypothetical protein